MAAGPQLPPIHWRSNVWFAGRSGALFGVAIPGAVVRGQRRLSGCARNIAPDPHFLPDHEPLCARLLRWAF